MDARNSTPTRKRTWPRFVVVAVIAALLVTTVLVVRSRRLPIMTRDAFELARAKWESHQPMSYDITVQVSGMQPGVYTVAVDNGIATAASFDGRKLTRPRTFGTWAVTGMFDTLSRDLAMNDQHGYLLLSAVFDPDLGIPVQYERIEMRTGAHDALQWEVTQFESRP